MWISKKKYNSMKETIRQLEEDKKELQTRCEKNQQKSLEYKVHLPMKKIPKTIEVHRYYSHGVMRRGREDERKQNNM